MQADASVCWFCTPSIQESAKNDWFLLVYEGVILLQSPWPKDLIEITDGNLMIQNLGPSFHSVSAVQNTHGNVDKVLVSRACL